MTITETQTVVVGDMRFKVVLTYNADTGLEFPFPPLDGQGYGSQPLRPLKDWSEEVDDILEEFGMEEE